MGYYFLPVENLKGRQLTYLNRRSALAPGSRATPITASADDLSTDIEEGGVSIYSKSHVSYHLTNFQMRGHRWTREEMIENNYFFYAIKGPSLPRPPKKRQLTFTMLRDTTL
ncbi:hypothetical protein EVAR_88020_1 [Eumeta japonica]|uniref:Uncharacterized protein n=1 Tax=Eumeta variegata TaxID=151549 RepID=A0A4C1VD29_EUMVA|nr:hypothetical protein EVAR_88020_1 [Eumeta japonica]